jgi:hypothetical protein
MSMIAANTVCYIAIFSYFNGTINYSYTNVCIKIWALINFFFKK